MSAASHDDEKCQDDSALFAEVAAANQPRPDVIAIIQIDEIMRGLSPPHRRAVVAWLLARISP